MIGSTPAGPPGTGFERQRPRTLDSLQAGRGIAAMLVVLHHTTTMFQSGIYFPGSPDRGFFLFSGRAGVDFFFVLSGFIIFHVHRRDVGIPTRWWTYAKKRVRRIYPTYWAVILPLSGYLLFAYKGPPSDFRHPAFFISAFLLVYLGKTSTVLPLGWTLYHEVLFYAVFGLTILNRRVGGVLLLLWFAGSVLRLFGSEKTGAAEFYFQAIHLLFAMGIVTALTISRPRIPWPHVVIIAGMAVFGLAAFDLDRTTPRWSTDTDDLLFGFGSSLLILGAVALEQTRRLRVPGVLKFLGDASYAIYLIHFSFLSFVCKVLVRLPATRRLPIAVCYVMAVSGTTLLSIAFHLGVERPLLRRLNRNHVISRAPVPLGQGAA